MRLQRAAFDTGEHLLICEDITDRERVQNALIESEERYRLLTDNSLTGIYIHQDGKFVFVNERLCQILGYPASEIIGQYFWEFVHEDDRRMVRERGMARSRARSTPTSHYEFRVLCRDGTTRWVDVLATTITYQGRPANMGNLADITERKQAEERLIATQGLLTAAVEQSPAGILVADAPDVRIRLANSAALGIRGETTDPLLQIPLDLHPGNWQTFRLDGAPYEPEKLPLSRAILEGKTVNNVEVIIRRRDGEDRHVLANAAPVRNRSGKIVAGVVVFLDITDRLRLEEQLRQAAKMEALGQLAGGVAHDFNNVLTAIIGYADLLAGQVSEDSARERVAQIGRAAETAAALTRQLLAFGRKQMLDIRVLNLNHCIQAVLPILQRLIGENIRIQTDLDFSIPHIRADPRQMEQIIMNLAVNARDAMPNGGQLAIETSEEHIRASQIPEQQDIEPGHHVVLKVADSGQGMDPYTKFRIFDPFFTTKGKGLGTGLGLSTVYGIVKQHRGHISVLSEPDHGTVFRLYFPRAEGPAEEPSTGQSPVEPTTTGETVLVIEDEEIVRDLTCDALNMLGYTPLTAADGEEAWRVCSTHPGPIDLVLTDVVLPETDGRSLFSRLCTVRPAMKVLYMSGYAESEIVGRGLIGGGVNFLQKPFSLRTLSQKLKDCLRST
jgi:PAS domain S-box-containing protein